MGTTTSTPPSRFRTNWILRWYPEAQMKTQPADKTRRNHLRASDLRGVAQLVIQATQGVAKISEGVHQSVWSTLGFPGSGVPGQTRGITGLAYGGVHQITGLVGKSLDSALAWLQPALDSTEVARPTTAQREAALAALNGVMGDRLMASNSPLATPMTLRYQGEPLSWQAPQPMPEANGKVLLMIHGLCMNDLQWHTEHEGQVVDHGETLASALGYTPVHVRYNSGLHISENGLLLSAQLERLAALWPTPIEELNVVAHSMGGLLIRSAFHQAREEGLEWPDLLQSIVFLGTPHHGSPVEKAGNWVDVILGSTPYTAPFAKIGQLRSAGITDLRYGFVLAEDWQGVDRFDRQPDRRRLFSLPEGVSCYTVAATIESGRSALADRLIGDGLVPLRSALGQQDEPRPDLGFAEASQYVAYRVGHIELLSSPEVTRQLLRWLS